MDEAYFTATLVPAQQKKKIPTWRRRFKSITPSTLLTKLQQLISLALAIQMVLMIVIWAWVIGIQYDPFSDGIMMIAAGSVLAVQLAAAIVFIKNVRHPNTFTLVTECLLLIIVWIYSSFGSYLGSLYKHEENAIELLIEHANRAVTTDHYNTLITGFTLGQQGILIIALFYVLQVLVHYHQSQKRPVNMA
jgi:hypothetical protein